MGLIRNKEVPSPPLKVYLPNPVLSCVCATPLQQIHLWFEAAMKFKSEHGQDGFAQLLCELEKEVQQTEEGRKNVAEVKRKMGETERKVLESLPPKERSAALASMSPEHRHALCLSFKPQLSTLLQPMAGTLRSRH